MVALCFGSAGHEKRVVVAQPADDLGRVDLRGKIERDAVGLLALDALQHVHVVGHGDVGPRMRRDLVVPAGPGLPARRQQPGIGVQHDLVGLVGKAHQHVVLQPVGVLQKIQTLIGMTGEDCLVEALHLAAGGLNFNAAAPPAH